MSTVQSYAPIENGRGKLSLLMRIIIMIEVGEAVKFAIILGLWIGTCLSCFLTGYNLGKGSEQ